MLGKLIKYDLEAVARIFIPIHAVFLLFCFAARFFYMDRLNFNTIDEPLVLSLVLFGTVITLLYSALSIFTWLLIAFRFYRNLFSKEGYLTWTLPVSSAGQLWAKILSGCILSAADVLIVAVGMLFLVTGKNVTSAYAQIAAEVEQELGMSTEAFALLFLLICLLSCIASVVIIYFSITIGQLFPAHRVLCAIAAYFILTTVMDIICVAAMLFNGYLPGYLSSGKSMINYLSGILSISLITVFIIAIAGYIGTHYIFKEKLNLL